MNAPSLWQVVFAFPWCMGFVASNQRFKGRVWHKPLHWTHRPPTILRPSWHQKSGDAPRMTSWEEFWNQRLGFEFFLIFLPPVREKGQSLRLLCPNLFWYSVGSLKNLSGLYGSTLFYFPTFPCTEKYWPLEFLDQEFNFSLSWHTVLWPVWILQTFSLYFFQICIAFWCQLYPNNFRRTDIMFFPQSISHLPNPFSK